MKEDTTKKTTKRATKKTDAAAEKKVSAKAEAAVASEESNLKFDKDLFKRSVVYNVRTLYRKDMEEATPQQVFQATSLAIKDQIMDNWIETQKAYEKQDPKMVYYLSLIHI